MWVNNNYLKNNKLEVFLEKLITLKFSLFEFIVFIKGKLEYNKKFYFFCKLIFSISIGPNSLPLIFRFLVKQAIKKLKLSGKYPSYPQVLPFL